MVNPENNKAAQLIIEVSFRNPEFDLKGHLTGMLVLIFNRSTQEPETSVSSAGSRPARST